MSQSKQDKLREWALSKVGCGYLWGATGYILTQAKLDQVIASQGAGSQAARYGKRWLGKQCYDCAQLVRWGLKAAGVQGVDISGASSQWNKGQWAVRGTLASLRPEAVCILYREDTGSSPMGHTGIALGDGTVIHAQSTATGVVRTQVSAGRWTHWAMPDWSLGEAAGGASPGGGSPAARDTVRQGARGALVTEMQGLLIRGGYPLPQYGADGSFGAETAAALRAFQAAQGLTVDGICGPKTWEALLAAAPGPEQTALYTVTIPGLSYEEAAELAELYDGAVTAREAG